MFTYLKVQIESSNVEIIFTLPTDENLFTIIRLNNYYAFRDYQRDTYSDYRYY